jgi:hypothetical protein
MRLPPYQPISSGNLYPTLMQMMKIVDGTFITSRTKLQRPLRTEEMLILMKAYSQKT